MGSGYEPLSSKFKTKKPPASTSTNLSIQDTGREVNKYGGKLTKEVKKSKGFDCSICDFTTTEGDFLRGHVARLGT